MARPSKLSENQWAEMRRRALAGESITQLAKAFGVSKGTVSKQVSKPIETIREVAAKVVDAEEALSNFPVSKQVEILQFAQQMRAMQQNVLAGTAMGAATFHRLAAIANQEAQKIDDANPEKSMKSVASVATLTKVANEAVAPALNLIAANKDRMKRLEEEEMNRPDITRLPKDTKDASRLYAELMQR